MVYGHDVALRADGGTLVQQGVHGTIEPILWVEIEGTEGEEMQI